jgi:hypothetical protein
VIVRTNDERIVDAREHCREVAGWRMGIERVFVVPRRRVYKKHAWRMVKADRERQLFDRLSLGIVKLGDSPADRGKL